MFDLSFTSDRLTSLHFELLAQSRETAYRVKYFSSAIRFSFTEVKMIIFQMLH